MADRRRFAEADRLITLKGTHNNCRHRHIVGVFCRSAARRICSACFGEGCSALAKWPVIDRSEVTNGSCEFYRGRGETGRREGGKAVSALKLQVHPT